MVYLLTLHIHLSVASFKALTMAYTAVYPTSHSAGYIEIELRLGKDSLIFFFLLFTNCLSNKSPAYGNLSRPNFKEISKPLLIKELFLSTLNLSFCRRSQFLLVPFTVKMSRIKAAQSQVLAVPSFLWAQNWAV